MEPTNNEPFKQDDKPTEPIQENSNPEGPSTPSQPPAPAEVNSSGNMSLKSKILTILFLALILVGAGLSYWLLKTDNNNNNTTTTANDSANRMVDKLTIGLLAPDYKYFPENTSSREDVIVNRQLFEGLVRFEDRTQIEPVLALSWTNPDNLTWVFKLKPNVKFHTGNTLTSADVVKSIEQFKANEDYGDVFTSTISSVEATDSLTVTIKTTNPDPVLISKLTNIYISDSNATEIAKPNNGTGPYQVKSGTTPTGTHIELQAFDDYHGGPVKGVQNLVIKVLPSGDELLQALKNHEYDFTDLNNSVIDNRAAEYGYDVVNEDDITINYLGLNQVIDSPLKNQDVRRAIYTALDVSEILKAYDKNGTPANQLVTIDVPGYNPQITRPVTSKSEAKKLLTKAGYENGLTLELTYFTATSKLAINVQEQLAEIGITIELDEHTVGATIGKKVFGEGAAQMWFAGYSTDTNDSIDVLNNLFNDSPNFNDADITRQIEDTESAVGGTNRLVSLQSIAKQLMDKTAWIPLYSAQTEALILNNDSYDYEIDANGSSFGGIHFAELKKANSSN